VTRRGGEDFASVAIAFHDAWAQGWAFDRAVHALEKLDVSRSHPRERMVITLVIKCMPMLTYPEIDPIALSLGPVKVHWYGIMYLLGFAAFWLLGRYRARRPDSGWSAQMVDDVLFYGVIGVIVGGRVGYMLFYGYSQLMSNPLAFF